jgi:hypothetical protein
VHRGPGLSRYFSVPLGILCLVGMIVGGLGWLAAAPLRIETSLVTMLLEVGIGSTLLFGLLIFAEIQARRSREVKGFCGSCGDLWTKAPKPTSDSFRVAGPLFVRRYDIEPEEKDCRR